MKLLLQHPVVIFTGSKPPALATCANLILSPLVDVEVVSLEGMPSRTMGFESIRYAALISLEQAPAFLAVSGWGQIRPPKLVSSGADLTPLL